MRRQIQVKPVVTAAQGQAAVAVVTTLDAAEKKERPSEAENHHGMRNRELLGGSGRG